MQKANRVKLLGTYRTPRFKYGDTVVCAIRGPVKIVGLSNGRIPWPKCRSGKHSRAIILYGALADAVRRESAAAVKHWFGVGSFTVWQWRKALGVDRMNEGTESLWQRWSPETCQSTKANTRRTPALKAPERGAKIAAALTGKKRPPEVIEAVRKANTGRKHTDETRRRMSEAQKGRIVPGNGKAWTPADDALLGTMKDRDVGAQIGKSEQAVSARRYVLNVAAFVKRKPHRPPPRWTAERDALLGTMSDADLARQMRCSAASVFNRRRKKGIPRFAP